MNRRLHTNWPRILKYMFLFIIICIYVRILIGALMPFHSMCIHHLQCKLCATAFKWKPCGRILRIQAYVWSRTTQKWFKYQWRCLFQLRKRVIAFEGKADTVCWRIWWSNCAKQTYNSWKRNNNSTRKIQTYRSIRFCKVNFRSLMIKVWERVLFPRWKKRFEILMNLELSTQHKIDQKVSYAFTSCSFKM